MINYILIPKLLRNCSLRKNNQPLFVCRLFLYLPFTLGIADNVFSNFFNCSNSVIHYTNLYIMLQCRFWALFVFNLLSLLKSKDLFFSDSLNKIWIYCDVNVGYPVQGRESDCCCLMVCVSCFGVSVGSLFSSCIDVFPSALVCGPFLFFSRLICWFLAVVFYCTLYLYNWFLSLTIMFLTMHIIFFAIWKFINAITRLFRKATAR